MNCAHCGKLVENRNHSVMSLPICEEFFHDMTKDGCFDFLKFNTSGWAEKFVEILKERRLAGKPC